MTNDCARSRVLDYPFTITIRVHDDGVGRGDVTVVNGGGPGGAPVALYSPTPTADVHDSVSPSGTFSAGGSRTYADFDQGDFTARWSGGVAGSRNRPAEFPLTIRQTWNRHRDFVAWLSGSGGPDDFTCSHSVTAVRQT